MFGPGMIVKGSSEYQFANSAHEAMEFTKRIVRIFAGKAVYFAGSLDDGCHLFDVNEK